MALADRSAAGRHWRLRELSKRLSPLEQPDRHPRSFNQRHTVRDVCQLAKRAV
jgi:hypothetical protein